MEVIEIQFSRLESTILKHYTMQTVKVIYEMDNHKLQSCTDLSCLNPTIV